MGKRPGALRSGQLYHAEAADDYETDMQSFTCE